MAEPSASAPAPSAPKPASAPAPAASAPAPSAPKPAPAPSAPAPATPTTKPASAPAPQKPAAPAPSAPAPAPSAPKPATPAPAPAAAPSAPAPVDSAPKPGPTASPKPTVARAVPTRVVPPTADEDRAANIEGCRKFLFGLNPQMVTLPAAIEKIIVRLADYNKSMLPTTVNTPLSCGAALVRLHRIYIDCIKAGNGEYVLALSALLWFFNNAVSFNDAYIRRGIGSTNLSSDDIRCFLALTTLFTATADPVLRKRKLATVNIRSTTATLKDLTAEINLADFYK